jgi:hypothetical protein
MAFLYKIIACFAGSMLASGTSFAVQDTMSSSSQPQSSKRAKAAAQPLDKTTETKTIYRQVMRDGSVLFSDVGGQGAVKTAAIPYKSTSNSRAMQLASQQKEHWRRQADGFDQRQARRDRELEQARRDSLYSQQLAQARDATWYGPAPRVVFGSGAYNIRGNFPQQGSSGVGAAHNVPASFIGSGFATSSPFAPSFGTTRR